MKCLREAIYLRSFAGYLQHRCDSGSYLVSSLQEFSDTSSLVRNCALPAGIRHVIQEARDHRQDIACVPMWGEFLPYAKEQWWCCRSSIGLVATKCNLKVRIRLYDSHSMMYLDYYFKYYYFVNMQCDYL